MKNGAYYNGCFNCRLCVGAAYQLPPFLFAGSDHPNVLVVAQNPGEIGGGKEDWRFDLGKLASDDPTVLKTLYDIDFITSHGHNQMSMIFGDGWLTSGEFMYTNAVRCRTPKNARPSDEMITNCSGWTMTLPVTPVIVLMGRVAVEQFARMMKKKEPPLWKRVSLTRGGKVQHIVTIPHYAAMKSKADFEHARDLVDEAKEKAGLHG